MLVDKTMTDIKRRWIDDLIVFTIERSSSTWCQRQRLKLMSDLNPAVDLINFALQFAFTRAYFNFSRFKAKLFVR